MEAVNSQQPLDAGAHRLVIVHDKNGTAGWHDVAPPKGSTICFIAHTFCTLSQDLHIVLTCKVVRQPTAFAEYIDHLLESRSGSSMPSRSAFATSSANE